MSIFHPQTPDHIPADFRALLPAGDVFEHIMAMQGQVFRDVPGRKTIRVTLGGQSYFIKQHFGVGWKEIFKNLLTARLPILGADTEWRAIHRLHELGLHTTPGVAYASRGWNPAKRRSFVITRDLGNILSLEDFCRDWATLPPHPHFKRRLIQAVADIARILHDHGLNHRDFYICHFCLDGALLTEDAIQLYLLDLHRVGIRTVIQPAARMKDIAALYFSAMDAGLNRRDYLRFVRRYRGSLQSLKAEASFWATVTQRARKLYHKFHGRWPDIESRL
ncbi:heptose I phosphotransferase [Novimethylophilus kurashikiensis]|uniref:Lipopolysaccharide core heptose(I) kinase n=1 Tax=Novimethylophilus kurashikiensis TaxID=1825523 RepID=A0A2R5F680_9PROT|nr:lipopolysaccharide core heptose(I) kinase RfaP [Novimethylophilus kurashikiensis]GBG13399.1 heptose I phosphotransferase [Novimethylophilus kurashikiensis]